MRRTRATVHVMIRGFGLIGALGCLVVAGAVLPGTPAQAVGHTVEMSMTVQATANGGYNYDGYAKGALTVTVPVGWQVIVQFANMADLAHSLIVLPLAATPPSVPATTPAFPGAATPNVQGGLPVKTTATVTFTASKPGTYEFVCGVPAHAVLGMWDKLVVSASATQPSVAPASAANAVALKER